VGGYRWEIGDEDGWGGCKVSLKMMERCSLGCQSSSAVLHCWSPSLICVARIGLARPPAQGGKECRP
jgi:hypothetical protein